MISFSKHIDFKKVAIDLSRSIRPPRPPVSLSNTVSKVRKNADVQMFSKDISQGQATKPTDSQMQMSGKAIQQSLSEIKDGRIK